MFTQSVLENSTEFKGWIGKDRVVLIHNTYHDNEDITPGYIVIHTSGMGKFSITRFWQSPNRKDQLDKIHVSADQRDISAEEVFALLLSDYSSGLK